MESAFEYSQVFKQIDELLKVFRTFGLDSKRVCAVAKVFQNRHGSLSVYGHYQIMKKYENFNFQMSGIK
jgi:hypothetical protein